MTQNRKSLRYYLKKKINSFFSICILKISSIEKSWKNDIAH